MTAPLEVILAPALDQYSADLAAHDQASYTGPGACRCGWTPARTSCADPRGRRAVGLHVAAAHRRASRRYDQAAAALVAAAMPRRWS